MIPFIIVVSMLAALSFAVAGLCQPMQYEIGSDPRDNLYDKYMDNLQ